jgi:hypothetical protein
MGHQVFVSHSSEDKLAADAIVSHLERNGIACWVAPRDILPGAKWAGSILKAIADAKVLVLVFSNHANASQHVRNEVERAVHHGLPLIPVRIVDVAPTEDLELFLSSSHWMDAVPPPFERHLERLSNTLKMLLKISEEAPKPPDNAEPPKSLIEVMPEVQSDLKAEPRTATSVVKRFTILPTSWRRTASLGILAAILGAVVCGVAYMVRYEAALHEMNSGHH